MARLKESIIQNISAISVDMINKDPCRERVFQVPLHYAKALNIPLNADVLTRWTIQEELSDGWYIMGRHGDRYLWRVVCKPRTIYFLKPGQDLTRGEFHTYTRKADLPHREMGFYKILGWVDYREQQVMAVDKACEEARTG